MRTKIILFLSFILMLTGCTREKEPVTAPTVTGEFVFTALKVGQADALVLRTANHTVIIDCGEKDDGDKLLEYLEQNGITSVDALIITHFDKDHVGGAAELLLGCEVKMLYTADYITDSKEYVKYAEAAAQKGIMPQKLSDGKNVEFTLDDVVFTVYPAISDVQNSTDNDLSLAVTAQHGSKRFLFAGDAESRRMQEILTQVSGKFDVLKVPHHGRYSPYSEEFVAEVSPQYALITCSDKNPAEEQLLQVLKNAGAKVYTTQNGYVSFTSNGEEITVSEDLE
ncbi:MAG: MBL fold metallo-hydrolase [Firmicutes bacterium]|nr:MBL fold metallo-hydrolase [Bacillota bacterium]